MSMIEECYGQCCVLAWAMLCSGLGNVVFSLLGELWSHWEGYNARVHLLDILDLTDVHLNIYGKNKLSFLLIIMTSIFVL